MLERNTPNPKLKKMFFLTQHTFIRNSSHVHKFTRNSLQTSWVQFVSSDCGGDPTSQENLLLLCLEDVRYPATSHLLSLSVISTHWADLHSPSVEVLQCPRNIQEEDCSSVGFGG